MKGKSLPELLKGLSKKTWIIIGVVAVVVIGTVTYFNNRQPNLIKKGNPNVTYSGYNGSGSARFDTDGVQKEAFKFVAKKEGVDEDNIDKMVNATNGRLNSSSMDDWYTTLPSDQQTNITKAVKMVEELDVSLNKSSNLSNGDKIKLSIKAPSGDPDNPIKPVSKTYTVSGLGKVKKESTKSVINALKVSFSGFNGHGQAAISSKSITSSVSFHVKNNGKLSNGDKVTISLPDSLIEKAGVKYNGAKSFTTTVSGLTDATKVGGIDDVQKLTDSMINDEFKSNDFSHYTNDFINMFLSTNAREDNQFGYHSDEPSSTVDLNEKVTSKQSKVQIIALYKVQDGNSDPQLEKVTLSAVPLTDGKLDVQDVSTKKDGNISSDSDSLNTVLHDLNADNVQIK